jgi:hypothetical protein
MGELGLRNVGDVLALVDVVCSLEWIPVALTTIGNHPS